MSSYDFLNLFKGPSGSVNVHNRFRVAFLIENGIPGYFAFFSDERSEPCAFAVCILHVRSE